MPTSRASDVEAPVASDPGSATVLALAVNLNGQDRGIVTMHESDQRLWASLHTLRDLGIALPEGTRDPVALDAIPGGSVRYHASEQSLDLVVPVEWLAAARSRINVPSEDAPVASSARGAVLNYDAQANFGADGARAGAILNLRAFAGAAVLESTHSLTSEPGGRIRTVRLDTSLAISDPRKGLTLRLGDTATYAVTWSRPTRIAGLQLGTNFALRPYRVTGPSPAFFGSAVLPSNAQIYLDGVQRYAGSVPPGPFEIGMGPARIDGSGLARLVLTDTLGRVTTYAMPIYATPQALRRGLSDWSLEMGWIRTGFGQSSGGYSGRPMASATWRSGLTDRLTLAVHGEADAAIQNLGLGAVWVIGSAGVLSASAAQSRSDYGAGYQFGLGYSWHSGPLNIAASTQRASRRYADLASGIGEPAVRRFDLMQVSWSSRLLGNLGASYIRNRSEGRPDTRLASVSLSWPLGKVMSLYLSANQDIVRRSERSAFMTLSFTPNARLQASVNASEQNGVASVDAALQGTHDPSGGLGWRLALRRSESGVAGNAEAGWLGPGGEARAGAAISAGQPTGYLAWSGSLALMDGGLFAGRRINSSFAVVSTNRVANVPVLLEGQRVGRTNARGLLLVRDLGAYQRNRLAIDVTDLPAGLSIENTVLNATPSDRAGVSVRFPIEPFTAVLMTMVDRDGAVLPPGTVVSGAGMEDGTVGFDGQYYIPDPEPGAMLTVGSGTSRCRIKLPAVIVPGDIVRMGRTLCEAGQ